MSSENQNDIKPFNEDIAKEHLKAGDSCFEKNDFEGAILNYTKIIEMEDDPISGFSELVYQALMKRGETKKLIKDLKGSKIDFLVAKLESTKSGGPNCSFDFSGIEA
jgi:hypothetical protein